MFDEECVVASEFEVHGVLVQITVRRGRVRGTDRYGVLRAVSAAHRKVAALVEAARPEELAPTPDYVRPTAELPVEAPTASGGSALADRVALAGAEGRAMRPHVADGSRPPPEMGGRLWVVYRGRNLEAEGLYSRWIGGTAEAIEECENPVLRSFPSLAKATEFMQGEGRMLPDRRR